jgi:hypothetical protein
MPLVHTVGVRTAKEAGEPVPGLAPAPAGAPEADFGTMAADAATAAASAMNCRLLSLLSPIADPFPGATAFLSPGRSAEAVRNACLLLPHFRDAFLRLSDA